VRTGHEADDRVRCDESTPDIGRCAVDATFRVWLVSVDGATRVCDAHLAVVCGRTVERAGRPVTVARVGGGRL
jgi:hypothetical protein